MLNWIGKILAFIEEALQGDYKAPYNTTMPINTPPNTPNPSPQPVTSSVVPSVVNPDVLGVWDNGLGSRHNVRVLCDLAGLSYEDKNILTACIARESGFDNNAKCYNRDKTGAIWSTDFGIVQCNDWFHIGPGKDFPSVEYVLANPQVMVQWMIDCMKAGKLGMWSSYNSGIYKRYL